jgi:cardiolipin synthase
MKAKFFFLTFLVLSPHLGFAQTANAPSPNKLFYSPQNEHRAWLNAIQSAHHEIFMEMFHLTDIQIINALKAKDSNQVKIQLILDSGNLKDGPSNDIANDLASHPNIKVYRSSPAFTQTHTKSMIIDQHLAYVTSMNLTNNQNIQRDYGIETTDPQIITEMNTVFNADIVNSQNQGGTTPDGVGQGKLIWSPKLSEPRLTAFIYHTATLPQPNPALPAANQPVKPFLYATVENLGDKKIEAALAYAASHGVTVKIIVPQCVLGGNGPRNYDFFSALSPAQVYVMPYPSSHQSPYMHGKMMVASDGSIYIGSVNYSTNSTQHNRELGIIFNDDAISKQLINVFANLDLKQAQPAGTKPAANFCPATTTSPAQ